MSGSIPGYPIPALDPKRNEIRGDPDEENPHELILDASEINEPLPPLPSRRESADEGE